jgi:hypothetical protein
MAVRESNPAIREIGQRKRHKNGRCQVNRPNAVGPFQFASEERTVPHSHGRAGRNVNCQAFLRSAKVQAAVLNRKRGQAIDRTAVLVGTAISKLQARTISVDGAAEK